MPTTSREAVAIDLVGGGQSCGYLRTAVFAGVAIGAAITISEYRTRILDVVSYAFLCSSLG
jgi:hypothetical protein